MRAIEILRELLANALESQGIAWPAKTTIEPPRERWATIWHDARLIVKSTTPPEELAPAEATASNGPLAGREAAR